MFFPFSFFTSLGYEFCCFLLFFGLFFDYVEITFSLFMHAESLNKTCFCFCFSMLIYYSCLVVSWYEARSMLYISYTIISLQCPLYIYIYIQWYFFLFGYICKCIRMYTFILLYPGTYIRCIRTCMKHVWKINFFTAPDLNKYWSEITESTPHVRTYSWITIWCQYHDSFNENKLEIKHFYFFVFIFYCFSNGAFFFLH